MKQPAPSGSRSHSWWGSWLESFYQRLTLNDAPEPADLIFVVAGRLDRKRYGLELFRSGIAPRLLLSIDRFEVSKMGRLDVGSVDELVALRDRTPPEQRHFFYEISSAGVCITKPTLLSQNTYGEVAAFRRFAEDEKVGRVLVVSTDIHLRRLALTFAKVFRGSEPDLLFCPATEPDAPCRRQDWWFQSESRGFVLKEALKLAAYRAILSLPDGAARWVMARRHQKSW